MLERKSLLYPVSTTSRYVYEIDTCLLDLVGSGKQRKFGRARGDMEQVSGLIAYYLRRDNPPFSVGGGKPANNVKNYLQTRASWQRSSRGPKYVVWNELDGSGRRFLQNTLNVTLSSEWLNRGFYQTA